MSQNTVTWENTLNQLVRQAQEELPVDDFLSVEEAPMGGEGPMIPHDEAMESGGEGHKEGPEEVLNLVEEFVQHMIEEAGEYNPDGLKDEDLTKLHEKTVKKIVKILDKDLGMKLVDEAEEKEEKEPAAEEEGK